MVPREGRSITKRMDRITLIPAERRAAAPPPPRSVKIEATGGMCNLRCTFCPINARTEEPTAMMDWALLCRILQEMRAAGVEEVGLFYVSEPFFKPQRLVDAITFAKNIGFPYVFVTTNGSLASPEWVERCMVAGLDSLKFSINFADDAQFTQIAQRPPRAYHLTLDNLAAARRVRDAGGYACGVYASSIQYDGAQQARMQQLVVERVLPYADEHYWLPLYSAGAVVDVSESIAPPTAGNTARIGARRPGLPCWLVWEGHIRASADGQRAYLSACGFGADSRFDMADLTETPFLEAWNGQAFRALRAAHLRGDVRGTPCEKCLAYATVAKLEESTQHATIPIVAIAA